MQNNRYVIDIFKIGIISSLLIAHALSIFSHLNPNFEIYSNHDTDLLFLGMKKCANLATNSATRPFLLEPVTLHKSYGKTVIP